MNEEYLDFADSLTDRSGGYAISELFSRDLRRYNKKFTEEKEADVK